MNIGNTINGYEILPVYSEEMLRIELAEQIIQIETHKILFVVAVYHKSNVTFGEKVVNHLNG